MAIDSLPTIYKRDSAGKIRFWIARVEDNRWRTVAGIYEAPSSIVHSEWTTCEGKQKRSDQEQARFEANAERTKKLARGYRPSLAEVDTVTNTFVKPMLAHKYEGWTGPCYSQPKLDGIRCIITREGMFSREGQPFVSCPHIVGALTGIFDMNPALILDGELYNHDLKDDFNAIVSAVKRQKPSDADLDLASRLVQYHVYDIIGPGFFGQRFAQLGDLFGERMGPIRRVETIFASFERDLDIMYENYLSDGYEGQMVRTNGLYQNKRSKLLLKRKEFLDAEFSVVSIEEGQGNWSGYAKRVTCKLPDGRTFGAGIRGTQAEMKALLTGPKPNMATIRYFALTPDGVPRFPVATKFHWGTKL